MFVFSEPCTSQSYKDEIDAYTAFKSRGHFTPHPIGTVDLALMQLHVAFYAHFPSISFKENFSLLENKCPVVSLNSVIYVIVKIRKIYRECGLDLQSVNCYLIGNQIEMLQRHVMFYFIKLTL